MSQPYATVEDIEDEWRDLIPAEHRRAAALLRTAKVKIDSIAPTGDLPTETELEVRRVVTIEMVKRALIGGVGPAVTQQTDTAGPFGRTATFANPTGDLYLTKGDKQLLGVGGQKAFTVSMLPEEGAG